MDYLNRLELIDFIVVETDRETEGDFEEDMLRDQLEAATDEEVCEMALKLTAGEPLDKLSQAGFTTRLF